MKSVVRLFMPGTLLLYISFRLFFTFDVMIGGTSGAGVMEADDRQVTTVFTI